MNKYYKLGIISTHKCNQNCYYCNNYDIYNNGTISIDLDYLKYALYLFNKNGIDNLYVEISGGEPGLISNIRELIDMLYDLYYIKKIDILSNGLIRKQQNELLNDYKSLTCIEHPALNIQYTNINYFYKDITFFNNCYSNLNQVLVLDINTINSLINNFNYYNELGLFNTDNIYFKIITPKTSNLNDELINKYNIFYYKLKKIYGFKSDLIFKDYNYILNNKNANDMHKTACCKISSMQFLDLDNKTIGQCSMDIKKSNYYVINNDNIYKTIRGILFDNSKCCDECIKYDTNAINILLSRYKNNSEYYNIIDN